MDSGTSILRNTYVMYALVFVVSLLQFSNTLNHDYVWDDTIVIVENPDVRAGIAGLGDIWHKQHSDYLHDQIGYRPIVLSTYAIEQEFFPMQPKVGHVINMLFFAILCVVILWFLREIVPPECHLMVLLTTLLFAVHPLHSEVVANIKSRDEIFQMLFSLVSIIFYHRWFLQGKWWQLFLSTTFFICAILSRENAVVTLGLIPLTVLFFGKASFKMLAQKLLPVLALGLLSVVIIQLSLSGEVGKLETAGMGIVYEDQDLGNGLFYNDLYGAKRVLNFNLVMLRYLKNFVWPLDLVYYYGYNHLKLYEAGDVVSIIGAITTVLLIIITIVGIKLKPMFAYGAIYFFVSIFPFLQLVNYMPDTMADRFAFSPSLGLCIVAVSATASVFKKIAQKLEGGTKSSVAFFCVLVIFGFYSYQTYQRNKAWKDNFTLFSTDINKLQNCAKAHEHYADVLHQKFLQTGDVSLIQDITYHYQASIDISDRSYYSFIKLGSNYASFGNPEMGIQLLKKAVELFPGKGDPNFYLGNALYNEGRYIEALPYLDSSIAFSPNMPDSYFLKIRSLEFLGSLDSALVTAQRAVTKFPNNIGVRDATCDVYMAIRDYQGAFAHSDTLLRLAGTNSIYWKKAIGMRQVAGFDSEAGQLYQVALGKGVVFDK